MLMIPANTPSATISVPVTGDGAFELDENFFVNLSNPTNAVLGDNQGVGSIINDDCFTRPPGIAAWYRAENNALDFQGVNNGTLENGITFAPGEVGQAFNLDGVDDSVLTPTMNIG